METLLLLFMILLTVLAIIIVCMKLRKPKRKLYFCKDIECKYGLQYCCYSCGQRKKCEAVCEDYDGSCNWRDECE